MKFKKIKDGVGDFLGFDAGVLADEIKTAIGDEGWVCNTTEIEIDINLEEDFDTPENQVAITDVIAAHGTQASIDFRVATQDWKKAMAEYDTVMPRSTEDLWDIMGIQNAPLYVQNKYNEKKAKRAEKPVLV